MTATGAFAHRRVMRQRSVARGQPPPNPQPIRSTGELKKKGGKRQRSESNPAGEGELHGLEAAGEPRRTGHSTGAVPPNGPGEASRPGDRSVTSGPSEMRSPVRKKGKVDGVGRYTTVRPTTSGADTGSPSVQEALTPSEALQPSRIKEGSPYRTKATTLAQGKETERQESRTDSQGSMSDSQGSGSDSQASDHYFEEDDHEGTAHMSDDDMDIGGSAA